MVREHTAAEWKACHDGKCKCKSVNGAEHPIANIISGKWGDSYPSIEYDKNGKPYIDDNFLEYGEIPEEEAIANALLIAAAPELLDACEYALKTLNYPIPHIGMYLGEVTAKTLLEAAIEKAKGHN